MDYVQVPPCSVRNTSGGCQELTGKSTSVCDYYRIYLSLGQRYNKPTTIQDIPAGSRKICRNGCERAKHNNGNNTRKTEQEQASARTLPLQGGVQRDIVGSANQPKRTPENEGDTAQNSLSLKKQCSHPTVYSCHSQAQQIRHRQWRAK